MNVYVVQREQWHYVDGSFAELHDVYGDRSDAIREATRLTDIHGYDTEFAGLTYNVVACELK